MQYILGALLGVCWGAVGALVNSRIIKHALDKNSTNALMAGNMTRMLVDVFVLLVVFVLRNVLPVNFIANIGGAAVGLSVCNVLFSYLLTKSQKNSAFSADVPAAEAPGEQTPVEVPAVQEETAKEKEIRELKERLAQLEAEKDES